nr:ribonuclease H-like domain, reverse transcriptase, RNA-dependent DNA polymerase [Tanacetum cinerariifolium]
MSTQKQATVALSSCESEFITATTAATQALWLKRLLSKLTHSEEEKVTIRVDNKSAIALMKNLVFHERRKHIDTKYHFIREHVEREDIQVKFVNEEYQKADILTKALLKIKFLTMRQLIGLKDLREWWDRKVISVLRQALFSGAAPNIPDCITINGQPGDLFRCFSQGTNYNPPIKEIHFDEFSWFLNIKKLASTSVANDKLTVITTDAVYTKQFTTNVIMVGPSQTTDVLLTFDQQPGRYYSLFRIQTTPLWYILRIDHSTSFQKQDLTASPDLYSFRKECVTVSFEKKDVSGSKTIDGPVNVVSTVMGVLKELVNLVVKGLQ